ncbi:MAG: hypothetical protein JRI58_12845 [Deltaproteobacteria bacterium]|nr:hypothetical protein [Deltaproteobacteria bacterium]
MRRVIEDIIEQIEGLLPAQEKRVERRLKKIIRHLNRALEDRQGDLWLDGYHVASWHRGVKVFVNLGKAVRELDSRKWQKLAPELVGTFREAAGDLLEVSSTLARTCYEEAVAGTGGDAGRVSKWLLKRAERELERGDELVARRNEDPPGKMLGLRAVHCYKSAWRFSQWVMRWEGISPAQIICLLERRRLRLVAWKIISGSRANTMIRRQGCTIIITATTTQELGGI